MNNTKPEEAIIAPSNASPAAGAPSFNTLGIPEPILALLAKNGFTTPTPIQHQAIPHAIQGKDVIGIAQTGTGKTLAFGIPAIAQLIANPGMRAAIILPTRELALQVDEAFRKIAPFLKLRSVVLIGGASMYLQEKDLRLDPQIIIATPGRMIDHLERRTLELSKVGILILDEADRMLDMGFAPQIAKILKTVPRDRQTMLFSATMPAEIAAIAVNHMKTPLRIEVAPQGTSADKVEQEMIVISKDAKFPALIVLLKENPGSVLVFTRTKHGAHRVCRWLEQSGVPSGELHSERSLQQRIKALDGFKKGTVRVLVATDIAARGIDVKDIKLVVNYDLPENDEDYVHRIGRTARAGTSGKAISFATPDQLRSVKSIERLIRKSIPLSRHPSASGSSGYVVDPAYSSRVAREMDNASSEANARSHGRGGNRGGSFRDSRGGSSRGYSPRTAPSYGSRPSYSSSAPARSYAPAASGSRPPNPYYRVGLDTPPAPAPRPAYGNSRPPSRPYHAQAPRSAPQAPNNNA